MTFFPGKNSEQTKKLHLYIEKELGLYIEGFLTLEKPERKRDQSFGWYKRITFKPCR